MGKEKKEDSVKTDPKEGQCDSDSNENVDESSERKHKKNKKSKNKDLSETPKADTEKTEAEVGEGTAEGKEKKKKKKKSRSDSESPTSENTVHSANDWEHADLGDDQRKDKFLKLMGAKKTDHHGKLVIGEHVEHQHKPDDPNQMNKKLEDQFKQGLEHKLKSGFKGHLGLGCHDEQEAAPGEKRKEETDEVPSQEQPSAKKKFMMSFVKSSDS